MDLKRTHMASDFGWFWAVAKPMMYILMFYVAISSGFKHGKDIEGTFCPYFIWLASGIVPWQFISDLLVGGVTCFHRHKDMVLRTRFPASVYPAIAVLPKLFIHFIMICVLIVLALILGVKPSIYWLQLPIYVFLTLLFIYIWVYMTALMNMLSADIVEFIKTIKTAFFWLSGILFNIRGRSNIFFKINPISFIAEGYRNVFAYHVWIWEQKHLLLNFCIVLLLMTTVTYILNKRIEKRLPEMF